MSVSRRPLVLLFVGVLGVLLTSCSVKAPPASNGLLSIRIGQRLTQAPPVAARCDRPGPDQSCSFAAGPMTQVAVHPHETIELETRPLEHLVASIAGPASRLVSVSGATLHVGAAPPGAYTVLVLSSTSAWRLLLRVR